MGQGVIEPPRRIDYQKEFSNSREWYEEAMCSILKKGTEYTDYLFQMTRGIPKQLKNLAEEPMMSSMSKFKKNLDSVLESLIKFKKDLAGGRKLIESLVPNWTDESTEYTILTPIKRGHLGRRSLIQLEKWEKGHDKMKTLREGSLDQYLDDEKNQNTRYPLDDWFINRHVIFVGICKRVKGCYYWVELSTERKNLKDLVTFRLSFSGKGCISPQDLIDKLDKEQPAYFGEHNLRIITHNFYGDRIGYEEGVEFRRSNMLSKRDIPISVFDEKFPCTLQAALTLVKQKVPWVDSDLMKGTFVKLSWVRKGLHYKLIQGKRCFSEVGIKSAIDHFKNHYQGSKRPQPTQSP